MSSYSLLYKKPAAKQIAKLSPQIRKRLKAKLEWFISQDNPLDFAEPLTKSSDAQYRFRVGAYRLLFDVEGKNIIILLVQHRRDVYKK
jgi:mRNA interferase RelE/StbE